MNFDVAMKLYPLFPILILGTVGVSVLILDLFTKDLSIVKFLLLQLGCLLGIFFLFQQAEVPINKFTLDNIPVYLSVDGVGVFCGILLLMGLSLSLMFSYGRLLELAGPFASDLELLMVFATLGGLVMVSAGNLMLLFLAFELLSVCVYILSASSRSSKLSAEAGIKYFVMGAFSSAFLLFGIALIYGATGSVELVEISKAAAVDSNSPLLLLGIGLMFFGFLFKVGAVPFHFWSPDVYQGSPTIFTLFMAVVVKLAAFGALVRVCLFALSPVHAKWVGLIWVVSVLSMTVGNLMALNQTSLKRLLAYSGISHVGFILMGLVAGDGVPAAMFYLFAYALMTVASFGVVYLVTLSKEDDDISLLDGIGWSNPRLGICMAIALLSLAGIPPLIGFLAKFFVIAAVFKGGFPGLAVIAVLNSAISLYYYLKLVSRMYRMEPAGSVTIEINTSSGVALTLVTVGIVIGGIFSSGLVGLLDHLFA